MDEDERGDNVGRCRVGVIFENRDENGGARIARIDAEISKTMILVVYDWRSRIQLANRGKVDGRQPGVIALGSSPFFAAYTRLSTKCEK
jgi:hypothetical protein